MSAPGNGYVTFPRQWRQIGIHCCRGATNDRVCGMPAPLARAGPNRWARQHARSGGSSPHRDGALAGGADRHWPCGISRWVRAKLLVETEFARHQPGHGALVGKARAESEWHRMRCPFQEGAFPFPVKYGYAAVGRVVSGPGTSRGSSRSIRIRTGSPCRPTAPCRCSGRAAGPAVLAANLETAPNIVWDGAAAPDRPDRGGGRGVVGGADGLASARGCRGGGHLVDVNPPGPCWPRRSLGFAAPGAAAGHDSGSMPAPLGRNHPRFRPCGRGGGLSGGWFGDRAVALRSARPSTAGGCGWWRARSARFRPSAGRAGPGMPGLRLALRLPPRPEQ